MIHDLLHLRLLHTEDILSQTLEALGYYLTGFFTVPFSGSFSYLIHKYR